MSNYEINSNQRTPLYENLFRIFLNMIQTFNMKSDSIEDIHLALIEPKIRPPEPLTDQWITIVFQPIARASPAPTKTNRRSVDRLEALEI